MLIFRGESPAKHTDAVAQVLQQCASPVSTPHVARDFFNQALVSQLPPDGIPGLFRRFAARNAVLFGHAQVASNFLVQLLLALLPVTEAHALLSSPDGFRMPAIASMTCFHRERSDASRFRPSAVSRYALTRCLFSESFHSEWIQPC